LDVENGHVKNPLLLIFLLPDPPDYLWISRLLSGPGCFLKDRSIDGIFVKEFPKNQHPSNIVQVIGCRLQAQKETGRKSQTCYLRLATCALSFDQTNN